MKQKRKNPYEMLLEEIKLFLNKIYYRKNIFMWRYPKESLSQGWNLEKLSWKVEAAEELGYEVLLQSDDDDLKVVYREKIPDRPWRFDW